MYQVPDLAIVGCVSVCGPVNGVSNDVAAAAAAGAPCVKTSCNEHLEPAA